MRAARRGVRPRATVDGQSGAWARGPRGVRRGSVGVSKAYSHRAWRLVRGWAGRALRVGGLSREREADSEEKGDRTQGANGQAQGGYGTWRAGRGARGASRREAPVAL